MDNFQLLQSCKPKDMVVHHFGNRMFLSVGKRSSHELIADISDVIVYVTECDRLTACDPQAQTSEASVFQPVLRLRKECNL